MRRFFDEAGFTEVECGLLQAAPCAETHLHGFATERVKSDGSRETLWLPTSPELLAKRLLAAGERRIYDLARAFRNGEESPIHAPEFTMLEWYRAEEPYAAVIADTLGLIRGAAAAHAAGVSVAADDGWSDIFTRVMAEKIEPALDPARLTVLYEYPAPEAALARRAAHDARVAERFEVYACGVELANGFGELTDAAEQRARWVAAMAEKERLYGERYPVDEDFLDAVAAMPAASGVALGFDRLVMLCTGASRIGQVIWTPLE